MPIRSMPIGRPGFRAAGLIPSTYPASLVWAYWTTLAECADRWFHDPRYSHCFLVYARCLSHGRRLPVGTAQPFSLGPDGPSPQTRFWTSLLRETRAADQSSLRIYWAWSSDGTWSALEDPRLTFAGQRVLYKLFVMREVQTGEDSNEDAPCLAFFKQFLPELKRVLFEPEIGTQKSEIRRQTSARMCISPVAGGFRRSAKQGVWPFTSVIVPVRNEAPFIEKRLIQ